MSPNSGFQALLYVNFIVKSKYRVDDVSEKMGIQPDTLYKYVEGAHVFPADRIAALTTATGDTEYLEYIVGRAGYSLIPKVRDKKTVEVFTWLAKIFNRAAESEIMKGDGE